MKRLNYSIWAIALVSLFAASCSKEAELKLVPSEEPKVEMVTLNFIAEKVGEETKTQAVIDDVNNKVNYEWTDEDEGNITVYLVNGASVTKVESTATKVSATQLKISATVPKADTYTIRAVLAREFYKNGQPMVSKYQSPLTGNFDPKGDILFSDDKEITTTGTDTGDMLLTFNRKVCVNRMTLKSLGAGEHINKIEISSNKDLVGYFDGSSFVATADSKSLILSYPNVEVPVSGEFPVYFTCMGSDDNELTVTVTTDSYLYSKTFGGSIDFTLGNFLDFRVTMPAGINYNWNLVTSGSTALAADDVIIITNSDADYALGAQNGTKYREQVSISSSADKSVISAVSASVTQITLGGSKDDWYLSTGTKYLYANGGTSNNYVNEGTQTNADTDNKGHWTIGVDAVGIASIVSNFSTAADARNTLRYNSSDSRFACYKAVNTMDDIRVYRKTAVDLTAWILSSIAVTTQPTNKAYSAGDSFDPTGMVVTATFTAAGKSDKVITLSNNDLTVSPTVLSAGDTKVTLSYRNKTVDVTGLEVTEHVYKWNLVSSLSGITEGTYAIAAYNSSKYYTVPKPTISGQTFTCTEATYSVSDGLTPPSGAGEFVFTAKADVDNAFYIYNTNLKKYLVATGSKTFGYVEDNSSDYGYWTFSTVAGGGFSGVFSVQHSSKTHYMRAYNNTVRCYDGASNNGVYLFIYE